MDELNEYKSNGCGKVARYISVILGFLLVLIPDLGFNLKFHFRVLGFYFYSHWLDFVPRSIFLA